MTRVPSGTSPGTRTESAERLASDPGHETVTHPLPQRRHAMQRPGGKDQHRALVALDSGRFALAINLQVAAAISCRIGELYHQRELPGRGAADAQILVPGIG